jgi:large subunit ribosomal protein L9
LNEPLKALGNYDVAIRLHREVTAKLKVRVIGETMAEESAPAEPTAEPAVAE